MIASSRSLPAEPADLVDTVPSGLVGLPEPLARELLTGAGYRTDVRIVDAPATPGTVVRTRPNVGMPAPEGSTVLLLVTAVPVTPPEQSAADPEPIVPAPPPPADPVPADPVAPDPVAPDPVPATTVDSAAPQPPVASVEPDTSASRSSSGSGPPGLRRGHQDDGDRRPGRDRRSSHTDD